MQIEDPTKKEEGISRSQNTDKNDSQEKVQPPEDLGQIFEDDTDHD